MYQKAARNFIFELSIKTRAPYLYGLEKTQVTSSLLAESYRPTSGGIGRVALYRPSLSFI